MPEERGERPALGVAWTVLEEAGSATNPQSPSQASRPGHEQPLYLELEEASKLLHRLGWT